VIGWAWCLGMLACGPSDVGDGAGDGAPDEPTAADSADIGGAPSADTGPPTRPTATTADTASSTGDSGEPGPAAVACPGGLSGPTAETTTACLVGRTVDGVDGFLGVRYGEPPVDERRWAAPVPVAPAPDPVEVLEPGSICVQSSGTIDGEFEAGEGSEDCLFLNVTRPAGTSPGDDLPVLFFVHGGGHTDGAGSQELYLGASFARPVAEPPLFPDVPALAQEAVVVTVNYRLAQLGFLSLPGLSAQSAEGVSGNQGMQDVLMALRWANDNVEAFGGDPDRILLFGESAGSVTSCSLLVSPEARGLFDAVLLQSGVCTGLTRTMAPSGAEESGYEQGERLVEALGCAGGSDADELACVRAVAVDDVMAVMSARQGFLGDGEAYGPVVDGWLIPEPPLALMAAGDIAPVPVVVGVNADEGTLFATLSPVVTEEVLEAALRGTALAVGWDADGLVALYDPAGYGGDVSAAWSAFLGDVSFVCPSRRTADLLAPHTDVRAYYFTRESWLLPFLGAYHGLELLFAFGTGAHVGDDELLSDRMVAAWASVAAGAPVVDPVGPWPLFGAAAPDGGTWVQLDHEVEAITGVRQAECDWFLDQGLLVP